MRREQAHPGRRLVGFIATLALAVSLATPVPAQGLFDPVARVDDSVITAWEVDQRARFLELFRTPGDTREIALERLIDERLQRGAAEAAGITATPEAIEAGMAEFAARAELPMEQFIDAIGQGGVTVEAFRDFVIAGILWREVVRARFLDAARPDAEAIDERLLEVGTEGGTRVLLNEIVLPADDPRTAEASRARAGDLARISDEDAFREAARRFSRAPTRIRGGELDWLAISGLPPEVQPAVAGLRPGQTTRPIELGTSIAVFHMRDREDVRAAAPDDVAVDFVTLTLGSAEDVARATAGLQTCNDLYTVARDLPEDRLRRETLPRAQIPVAVRTAIAPLDPGETTTLPGEPGTLVMLCGEELDTEAALNRPAVAEALANRRLGARAARLLAELRASATITREE